MSNKIGRNAPCPCGSGKKYKACCMNKSQPAETERVVTPQFRFKPGSYGDVGQFVPSIACLKQLAPNNWSHHFVLVKPTEQHSKENDAAEIAEADLANAFLRKEQTGSDLAVAEYLKSQDYVKVSDFRIVQSGGEMGWRNLNKPLSDDLIGYSAFDPGEDCYEYNENECYVADSPESLKKFLANAMLPVGDYRIDEVRISDFLKDYGCSCGSYALEPEALKRFEQTAASHGFEYEVEPYEDYGGPVEPKIFIVNFSGWQRSEDEM
jgi:hypothetical protein